MFQTKAVDLCGGLIFHYVIVTIFCFPPKKSLLQFSTTVDTKSKLNALTCGKMWSLYI